MTKNKKVAVIGAGISGVSCAQILQQNNIDVIVYEGMPKCGGLIKCSIHDGFLFHRVGGHVFNSKNNEVSSWFWAHFNKETEFIRAERNASIYLDNMFIDYPIENNIYKLPQNTAQKIIRELLLLSQSISTEYDNLESFLLNTFGSTLYNLYFKPYNEKIWNGPLTSIPLKWLDGKLPMPNLQEIFEHNIFRSAEKNMVHSCFYYPVSNGSQFIIDRLSYGLNIVKNTFINNFEFCNKRNAWIINEQYYDSVIYTGDVRRLSLSMLTTSSNKIREALQACRYLRSNGTSNLLCKRDKSPYSWIYFPEKKYKAHRVINTGNFSITNNNSEQESSCVLEFSGKWSHNDMCSESRFVPGIISPIASNYEENSYIIHDNSTEKLLTELRILLNSYSFFLCGRFSEWQYYNMDKAIESALSVAGLVSRSL